MSKKLIYALVLALGLVVVMNVGIAGDSAEPESKAVCACAEDCTCPTDTCKCAEACVCPKDTSQCQEAAACTTEKSACAPRRSCAVKAIAAGCCGR